MAEKFIPCINPCDNLALLTEIIKTLRAAFGMPAAVYDESKGGLIVPDDYSTGIGKPAVPEVPKELPAEEPRAGKAKGK